MIRKNKEKIMGNNQELWQAILGEMELLISKPNFTTWFKQTYIYNYEENKELVIAVPNAFTKSWFEKKYHHLLTKVLGELTGNYNTKISYQIVNPNESLFAKEKEKKKTNTSPSLDNLKKTGLNPKYTFANFIIGRGNELAHAAALAIVKKPGETYNPLFIYGDVGLGKTHLIQAVGNEILKKYPDKKVLYVSCETFTNDFVNALSLNNINKFKERYRQIDVLLVDDIQFLSGKEQTQEAFFHTFNELHQENKQIILTSDRPPKSISTLEDRLISRFEWGMIADISSPDLETRSAILKYKAQEKNFPLSNEIIEYLAANIKNNIRELEGALNKLIAFHQINNTEPTLESAKKIIFNLSQMPRRGSLTPQKIIKAVTDYFNISKEDLLGSCRKKNLVIPRQLAMYLMREEINYSYPNIGQELGKRDHTTVMYACEKIKKELESDGKIQQDLKLIKQQLYNNLG